MLPRILRPVIARAVPLPALSPRLILLPIHARCLSTSIDQTTSQLPSSSEVVSPPSPPPEPVDSPTETGLSGRGLLPYFVGKNNLNNFSVYELSKQGGNRKITLLKKGEGDLIALRDDIREVLQMNLGDVSVNSRTGHIVIKGHKRDQVLNFLYQVGF
ncbi:Mitochondrial large subunit ribosomal protein [Parahypoxylon ruwenzoriense]